MAIGPLEYTQKKCSKYSFVYLFMRKILWDDDLKHKNLFKLKSKTGYMPPSLVGHATLKFSILCFVYLVVCSHCGPVVLQALNELV